MAGFVRAVALDFDGTPSDRRAVSQAASAAVEDMRA